jgi:hypothetical protein
MVRFGMHAAKTRFQHPLASNMKRYKYAAVFAVLPMRPQGFDRISLALDAVRQLINTWWLGLSPWGARFESGKN